MTPGDYRMVDAVLCKCGTELQLFEAEDVDDIDGEVFHRAIQLWAAGDFDVSWYLGLGLSVLTHPSLHDVGQVDEESGVVERWHIGSCPAELDVCRVCGCHDLRPCQGPCHWVEADLCSGCVEDKVQTLEATS